MENRLYPNDFSDHDRRWLVHVFAALTNHIDDELSCKDIPYYDENAYDDNRLYRLKVYIEQELHDCMARAHNEEANPSPHWSTAQSASLTHKSE
jgi:hypothetical protein